MNLIVDSSSNSNRTRRLRGALISPRRRAPQNIFLHAAQRGGPTLPEISRSSATGSRSRAPNARWPCSSHLGGATTSLPVSRMLGWRAATFLRLRLRLLGHRLPSSSRHAGALESPWVSSTDALWQPRSPAADHDLARSHVFASVAGPAARYDRLRGDEGPRWRRDGRSPVSFHWRHSRRALKSFPPAPGFAHGAASRRGRSAPPNASFPQAFSVFRFRPMYVHTLPR